MHVPTAPQTLGHDTTQPVTVEEILHRRRTATACMRHAHTSTPCRHILLPSLKVLYHCSASSSSTNTEPQTLGYDTTQPVTVEEMLHHCRAVRRGAHGPLLVGDLPFGSYETSPEKALEVLHRACNSFGHAFIVLAGS